MILQRRIITVIGLLLSLLTIPSAFAFEDALCVPFEHGKVDQSLIAKMLAAAEDGYLYRIKLNSSKMGFHVDSPIGLVTVNFQKFKGAMVLDGLSGQTLVSIETDSLETNGLFIERLLKSNEFFDVEKFPDILFIGSGFEWLSDTRAVLKGKLTMHGLTKSVAFYVEITEVDGDLGDSDTIIVEATTTVQRSEFGMQAFSSLVSDKVNLFMSIEAERYSSL